MILRPPRSTQTDTLCPYTTRFRSHAPVRRRLGTATFCTLKSMPSHAKPASFQAAQFRAALGRFPTGVTVITAEHPDTGAPIGLTISSFTSVSLQPPMVLWTLTHTASSLALFERLERYVIHVLLAAQVGMARRFAHGPHSERFQGLALGRAPAGPLMLSSEERRVGKECVSKCRSRW